MVARIPLTPPDLFGVVEKDIYRSNVPSQENIGFLETLKLRSVILISGTKPTATLQSFVDDEGIVLYDVATGSWQEEHDWRPIPESVVKDSLELALRVENYPTVIMCSEGTNRTGVVVGILRRIQRWSFNSTISEYRAFCGRKYRPIDEHFIELFDTDLITIPKPPPAWLSSRIAVLNEVRKVPVIL